MQDQHFMQSWNQSHRRFSADLDRGLRRLGDHLSRRGSGRKIIRNPYGIPAETQTSLSPAAKASLRGLAASVLTIMLWVVVLALATPAPGLAASNWASLEASTNLAYPPLA